jgi:hypothetical protein
MTVALRKIYRAIPAKAGIHFRQKRKNHALD